MPYYLFYCVEYTIIQLVCHNKSMGQPGVASKSVLQFPVLKGSCDLVPTEQTKISSSALYSDEVYKV